MPPSTGDVLNIFSEGPSLAQYLPALTFGYWYVITDCNLYVIISGYTLIAGTHRFVIRHRTDTPDSYSKVGKVFSGWPLFLSYLLGTFVSGYYVAFPSKSEADYPIALVILAVNAAYSFGMLYVGAAGDVESN